MSRQRHTTTKLAWHSVWNDSFLSPCASLLAQINLTKANLSQPYQFDCYLADSLSSLAVLPHTNKLPTRLLLWWSIEPRCSSVSKGSLFSCMLHCTRHIIHWWVYSKLLSRGWTFLDSKRRLAMNLARNTVTVLRNNNCVEILNVRLISCLLLCTGCQEAITPARCIQWWVSLCHQGHRFRITTCCHLRLK